MNNNKNILIIGHKGAKSIAPENSLKSFQKAIELNADFIEFDLRLSEDGEIVIIHDENLLNVTGHDAFVHEMTLKEIKQLDIGEGEKIPTLTELIKITRGKIKLLPEIKDPGVIMELLKIKEIEPDLKLGYLIPRALTYKRTTRLYARRASKNEIYAIHPYYHVVDREFVEFAHEKGLKVNVWTVNEESLMRRLIDLGVDGIMTDDLPLLNQVLETSY
jgi:glycerophosphoryl diester phosphodiesterase